MAAILVDFEAVLLGLKEHIATKPHHGQRELALVISQLEVQCRIEEGLPERALRMYGWEFFAEAVRDAKPLPPSPRGRVPRVDGNQVRALRGDSSIQSEEDTHVRHNDEAYGHSPSRIRAGAATGSRS